MWRTGRSLVAMFAAMVAGSGVRAAEDPLRLSFVPSNAIYWDIETAIDKGFFRDEGFAPEVIVFQSSAQSIQLLVSGQVQMAAAQPEVLLLAVKNGAKGYLAMSAPAERADWLLVGRPDIRGLADVRGKFFGTGGLQVGENWWTWRVLAGVGISPQDISTVQVGTSALKFAALQKGSIAFTVLFQPTAQQAVAAGMTTLHRFSDGEPFPPILYSIGEAWAAEARRGERLSRALVRAHRWLFDPANREEAIAILRKYTKREPEIAAPIYDAYFGDHGSYSPDGAIDATNMQQVIALMTHYGALPVGAISSTGQYLLPKALGGLARR
jgi:ABC-type nitrate/sulfonate/bicarbonate transport system substrate-binding protein